jgi:cytidyltransferase-like protein
MIKQIVVVSGGFDPIHSGHIEYLKGAKHHGNYLIVALNSDEWLIRKKGKYFMAFQDRKIILENLSMVNEVLSFADDISGSCINALETIKRKYPGHKITFCNGGDRNKNNIPEMSVKGIHFSFGVGGENKTNSSSSILRDFKFKKEERVWGKFYDLFVDNDIKVKELIILPGKGMSFQKHEFRNEIWFVSKGTCIVNFSDRGPNNYVEKVLNKWDSFKVNKNEWHQLINNTNHDCHIIEIQYGNKISEDDIERLRFYENN